METGQSKTRAGECFFCFDEKRRGEPQFLRHSVCVDWWGDFYPGGVSAYASRDVVMARAEQAGKIASKRDWSTRDGRAAMILEIAKKLGCTRKSANNYFTAWREHAVSNDPR